MIELNVFGSASGESDAGAGVSSGTTSTSGLLFPLTLITVSTVACMHSTNVYLRGQVSLHAFVVRALEVCALVMISCRIKAEIIQTC